MLYGWHRYLGEGILALAVLCGGAARANIIRRSLLGLDCFAGGFASGLARWLLSAGSGARGGDGRCPLFGRVRVGEWLGGLQGR